MSAELEVTSETVVTVRLGGEYAAKVAHSLGRVLASIDHLDHDRREQLVNTHTVDDLVALKTALFNAGVT
jgi:hypothetical protein